jgi:hypothetical protein
MPSKRKRARGKRAVRAVKPRGERIGAEDLNAESRALLRGDDKPRSVRPKPGDDASVEDPLLDWPED